MSSAARSVRRGLGFAGASLVPLLILAALAGGIRWHERTRTLRAALEASRVVPEPRAFDPRELETLPAPVRRFFGVALRPGQPVVTGARLKTEGEFLVDPSKDRWMSFTADQLVVARPPGFDWDARMQIVPGFEIFVRDAYRAGAGILRAEVLAFVKVAAQDETPELAKGELMRWLGEACWLPTALLPSQGVRWEALDEGRARATLADRGTSVSLEFRFGGDGFVTSVFAPDRPRTVGDRSVPTPWEATWAAWSARNGMRVPSAGSVAWLLPEGPQPYWRGRLKSVAYVFADEVAPRQGF